MGSAAVEFENVGVAYGDVVALDGVSLSVSAGNCLAIVGESGSGKTTLLRLINRLVEPRQGRVLLNGRDVATQDAIALRRRIGYVPQEGGLLPHWRVLRNAALVPVLLRRADAETAAGRALELVGLPAEQFAQRWPHELSGGQRQRVALARALAGEPDLLLLDEAFGALDAITRAEVQSAFATVQRRTGVTSVLVTHDLAEACRLGTRIAVLRRGRLEQVGTPAEITQRPGTEYVRDLVESARSAWAVMATGAADA